MDKGLHERLKFVVERPFVRVPYTEAVEILEEVRPSSSSSRSSMGMNLQSEHERFLTEEHFKSPVTVFNYPREIKPFYMRLNDDGKTVTAMDVLVPGIGEVIGGAQREERLEQLLENMKFHKLKPEDYWWYAGPAPLRHRAARRVRPGLRAAADVPDRRVKHPRRDPVRAHARQRGVLNLHPLSSHSMGEGNWFTRLEFVPTPQEPDSSTASARPPIASHYPPLPSDGRGPG